ncbi:MAG: hypothetical protein JNM39_09715 [Bdellovibrionaceae bacterium]|nr:hypothetical protein [Pseudobdellovibrionaceae bacterium]
MQIHETHLFDSATYKRIEVAIAKAKDMKTVSAAIQNAVCDGTKSKVKASLFFHLVFNRPTQGTPLDVAAQRNRLLASQVPLYLQRYWIHEASRPELVGQKYNPDFSTYAEMLEAGMERKWANRRTSVGVPFLTGVTKSEIEKYFSNAHAVPNLRDIQQTGPVEWYPSRSFLSVDVGNHQFILSNKVSDFLVGAWGYENYGTEIQTEIDKDSQMAIDVTFRYFSMQDGWEFRNHSSFAVSSNSWKLEDGSIAHPLILSFLDDLAVIRKLFTFRIPKADLERLFEANTPDALKYFGYDFHSGNFSAESAIEFQDHMWKDILSNQTQVFSTAKDDGSVEYEVRPSFEAFCRWAVPISSLRASD